MKYVVERMSWGDTIRKATNEIKVTDTRQEAEKAMERDKERMRGLGWAIADTVGLRKNGEFKDYVIYEIKEKK